MKNLLKIVLFSPFAFVSTFSNNKPEYQFHELSLQGVSGNEVTGLVQDDKGYVWIGTVAGLNCYDGYRNTLFDIPGNDGKPYNRVFCLEKDSCGNLWIGRDFDHLAILDFSTRRFVRISYCPPKSIPFSVCALKAVGKNEMWAGTGSGEIFKIHYQISEVSKDSIVLKVEKVVLKNILPKEFYSISSFLPVANRMLVSSWGGGVISINRLPPLQNIHAQVIEKKRTNYLFHDSRGNIWMATNKGVRSLRYLPDKKQYIDNTPDFPNSLRKYYNICWITEDAKQNLYLSTEVNGLYVYKPTLEKTRRQEQLANYNKTNSNLFSNHLSLLYLDRNNNLWIGTLNDGVAIANLNRKKFHTLRYYPYNTPTNNIVVSSILEDRKNRIWVATDGDDGLYCFNSNTGKRYHLGISQFPSYPSAQITKLTEDRHGNIWCCSKSGLSYFPSNADFTGQQTFTPINDNKLILNGSLSIVQDEYDRYWVAMGSLLRAKMDLKNNVIASYFHVIFPSKTHQVPPNYCYINNLTLAEPNTLWAGCFGGGMFRITYNGRNDSIVTDQYLPSNKKDFYISNKTVRCILFYSDSVWAGTDNGLNLYTRDKNDRYLHRKTWYTNDGLPSNKIGGILHDKDGNLWISTNNGLCKFSANRRSFVHYRSELQSNTLTCETSRFPYNTLYFGTTNGVNYFHPNEIVAEGHPPKAVLTNLLISNEDILPNNRINGQVILKKNLSYTDKICLSYKNNLFSLQFSTFDFDFSKSNKYLYKLEGFDNKWMTTYNHENAVTYSNLPPGTYTFKVAAINNNGQTDTQPATLDIVVGTPPWKSTWAYLAYSLFLAIIIWLIVKYYKNKIRLQNEIQLEKSKREQEHELAEMKANFFTTVSHELRTPLTLLVAPLSEIKSNTVDNNRMNELHELIAFNAEKLMHLVNQMLDFDKNENGTTTLRQTRINIVEFLRKLHQTFEPLARQKNISLDLKTQLEEAFGNLDLDVMDKILSNLVFNAIKYTPENGHITMDFDLIPSEKEPHCCIKIIDTGVGIDPDQQKKIFEKYYQQKKGQGYGIGLSVVRELVQRHRGTIDVESTPGKGSIFTVRIPISETRDTESPYTPFLPDKNTSTADTTEKNNAILLIVEDNRDLRQYLCKSLSDKYRIIEAVNGQEGIQKALEYLPDLILSDIMMPEMDGIALSSAIKFDPRTNHIPLLFLTAKDGLQEQQKGLATGAEDYIVKPFDMQIVRQKIQNLLRLLEIQRKKQRKKFLSTPISETSVNQDKHVSSSDTFQNKAAQIIRENSNDPGFNVKKWSEKMGISRIQLYRKLKEIHTTPSAFIQSVKGLELHIDQYLENDAFIQKATLVVVQNMSNPAFETMHMCSLMNMNYMQLHRKLKSAINMSANEFIRTVRMKQAAELLNTGKYRISEVMFKIGLENPSYFAKMFRLQYGKNPREYSHEKRPNTNPNEEP